MSRGLNKCMFIGNLGKDPEVRYMPSGEAVANFSIAIGNQWKDKETGEKKEHTEWVNVVAFRKLADIIGEYLKKGAQVYIEGRMQTRKWQDKNGNDRWSTEIIASDLKMLGTKSGGGDAKAQSQHQAATESAPPINDGFDGGGFDDDIPF